VNKKPSTAATPTPSSSARRSPRLVSIFSCSGSERRRAILESIEVIERLPKSSRYRQHRLATLRKALELVDLAASGDAGAETQLAEILDRLSL